MPEFYNLAQQDCMQGREAYPLRPGRESTISSIQSLSSLNDESFLEHIESLMYLFKATDDDTFLFIAADIFEAIESCCKTNCGYTSVSCSLHRRFYYAKLFYFKLKSVKDHRLDNRMESFFLAETVKYLYLIFDENNFLHATGEFATEHRSSSGKLLVSIFYLILFYYLSIRKMLLGYWLYLQY